MQITKIFGTNEVYHIFNRGIDRRPVFTSKKEFERGILTGDYYRFSAPLPSLSHLLQIPHPARDETLMHIRKHNDCRIDILAYCLMPNHFHFLLRQKENDGISRFISDFTNSFTRYFNAKRDRRIGPIFQGTFKSVHIEDEDQLVHISRYIHLNPVIAHLVAWNNVLSYSWSSLHEYVRTTSLDFCEKDTVLSKFSSTTSYLKFIEDQIAYARTLDAIKHLALDE